MLFVLGMRDALAESGCKLAVQWPEKVAVSPLQPIKARRSEAQPSLGGLFANVGLS